MPNFDDFTEELHSDEFREIADVDELFSEFSDENEKTEPEAETPSSKRKAKKRKKKNYFLRFLFVLLFLFGLYKFALSDFFTVTDIAVEGNCYYTASQISVLSGLKTGGNIFKTGTADAKKKLLENPYIKFVKIRKKLRGTIQITVEERLEYAAVPYGDRYILIDDGGMVLRISAEEPKLPLLEGMSIINMTPGSPLDVEQAYLLTDTLELLSVMKENELYFKKVYFSTVVVKAYIYDDFYCEGTPENIKDNMKAVAQMVAELYAEGINKGIIRVGKDCYLSHDPNITE